MAIQRIDIPLGERAVVHVNGRPVRWLSPGRHWMLELWSKIEVFRFKTDAIVAELRPEQAKLAPVTELQAIVIGADERGVIHAKGKPVRWLKPGRQFIWRTDESVSVEVIDASAVSVRPLPKAVAQLAPADDYVEVTVPQGAVALRFVDGALDAELGPGRHAAFTVARKVNFSVMDMRERVLAVTGQEVMTKDRVTLRLNLSATFKIADAKRVATVARDADEVLYLAVQLATREAVTARTLDELLADRDALRGAVFDEVVRRAEAVGLEAIALGLKDIVLPGEMKTLLNRVIEAKKQAEANVILRREEAAATRAQAQTAKLLSEEPALMRLKEIEAYAVLAEKVGKVHVVVGADGMSKLSLTD